MRSYNEDYLLIVLVNDLGYWPRSGTRVGVENRVRTPRFLLYAVTLGNVQHKLNICRFIQHVYGWTYVLNVNMSNNFTLYSLKSRSAEGGVNPESQIEAGAVRHCQDNNPFRNSMNSITQPLAGIVPLDCVLPYSSK